MIKAEVENGKTSNTVKGDILQVLDELAVMISGVIRGICQDDPEKKVLVEKGLLLAYLSLTPGKSTLTAVHFGGKERNDGEGN